MDENIILLVSNAFLYVLTFWYFSKKKTVLSLCKAILLLYSASACSSVALYLLQGGSLYVDIKEKITFFPFVYLYCMIFLALFPLLKINKNSVLSITPPSTKLLECTIIIIVLTTLPTSLGVIASFKATLGELMLDPVRADIDGFGAIYKTNKGVNFLSVFSGIGYTLAPLFLMYYLSLEKHKKLYTLLLCLVSILSVLGDVSSGNRGVMVQFLIVLLFLFIFFRSYYSERLRRKISFSFILVSIGFSFVFFLITLFKFGMFDNDYIYFQYVNYFGQNFLFFNSYGLDAGGIRYGTRTATMLTYSLNPDLPSNYVERLSKFSYMKMNEGNFSTFVGDFTLDYGPIVAFLLFLFFCIAFRKVLYFNGQLPFYKLLPIYYLIKLFASGWYLYPFCNLGGNFQIIILFVVFVIFREDHIRTKRNVRLENVLG